MPITARHFLFLLTVLFGNLYVGFAQTIPADTSKATEQRDLLQGLEEPVDTNKRNIRLSTDSIYGTQSGTEDGGFLDSEVQYTAEDSIIGSPSEGVVYLYNKAVVTYQDIKLEAGFIRFNLNTSELYAEGITDSLGNVNQKPIFSESGKSYRADAMRYNFENKKASIRKIITKEGEGYLHGSQVKKVSDKVFFVKNASFTTCTHEDPHFRINTPKAKVITGEKVVTQFAYLEILDVPTPLMVPFGFFPTTSKRQSGIILPTYGSSDFRGYFLRNGGFYWAANDYFDLALTGDIYTQGGYGFQVASSYSKRYGYRGNVSFNYNLLRFGEPEFAKYISGAFQNSSDYKITWSHTQDPKARPDFRFSSNVNIQTQNFLAINGTNTADLVTNTLASSVSFQKIFPNKPYNLTISLNHSQNNSTREMILGLPRVNFGVNRVVPFERRNRVGPKAWYEEIFFTYTVDGKNDIRTRVGSTLLNESIWRDSSTAGIEHRLPIQANYKVFKYFTLNPSFNYGERWLFRRYDYAYIDSLGRAEVVDTVNGFFANRDFSTGASLNTVVYGTWNYRGKWLRALRHQLSPSVNFTYSPDFSTDFWGYYQEVQADTTGRTERRNRFINSPYRTAGAGEQGLIGFNLQNVLEGKFRDSKDTTGTGTKKVKILERLTFNSSYNLAAESFNWAPINVAATSSILNRLITINYTGSYDLYGFDADSNKRVNRYAYEVNGKWLRNTNHTLNLGLSLTPESFGAQQKARNTQEGDNSAEGEEARALGLTAGDVDYYTRKGFVDFNVPWTVNFRYNLSSSANGLERTIRQSLTVDGTVTFTENWAATFATGYDFERKGFAPTSMNFTRKLHCWNMTASWIPFGFAQQYTLTIQVNAQMLSDLKLERRRGVGDFVR